MTWNPWKDVFVNDLDAALQRARHGVAYLHKRFGSDWDEFEPDLDRLNIASPMRCVLGQFSFKTNKCFLISSKSGIQCGFGCGYILDIVSLGWKTEAMRRTYDLLTQAWKIVLTERKAKREAEKRAFEFVPKSNSADVPTAQPTIAV